MTSHAITSIRRRGFAAIAAATVGALAVVTSTPAGAAEEPAAPLEAFGQGTVPGLDLRSSPARGQADTEIRADTPGFRLSGGRFTAFDLPGVGATEGIGANNRGEVVGGYLKDGRGGDFRGFIRDGRGRFTRFDVPRAAGTTPLDVNDRRQIVGNYRNGDAGPLRGFLRARSGRITRIDFPDAVQTQAFGINGDGRVVGQAEDADGTFHGYLWEDGRFTMIDGPEGSLGALVSDINDAGEMVGSYIGADGSIRGFLLSEGRYTTFAAPGAQLTVPFGLNNRGQISGFYGGTRDNVVTNVRGFVLRRGADGPLSPIDFPGAVSTLVTDIDDAGSVFGVYTRIPLSVKPRRQTVRQGESATFRATIPNPSGYTVRGVKVCVRAPREGIRVKRCVDLGTVDDDAKVRFEAKARRSARPRSYGLRFTASATGVDPVTAKARLRVKARR